MTTWMNECQYSDAGGKVEQIRQGGMSWKRDDETGEGWRWAVKDAIEYEDGEDALLNRMISQIPFVAQNSRWWGFKMMRMGSIRWPENLFVPKSVSIFWRIPNRAPQFCFFDFDQAQFNTIPLIYQHIQCFIVQFRSIRLHNEIIE